MAEDTMERAVTSSLGAMAAVLGRLGDKDSLPKGVDEHELETLKKGLEEARYSFEMLSAAQHPSFADTYWMKEVRDLSYDAEDYLDTVRYPGGTSSLQLRWMLTKTKRQQCPWVARDISYLNHRLEEVNKRRMRYQPSSAEKPASPASSIQAEPEDIEKHVPEPDNPAISKDIEIVLEPDDHPVSWQADTVILDQPLIKQVQITDLDKPVDDLVRLLAFDKEQQLKVVPILGSAGVGKTELARRLYDSYGGRFHCRAFVRVSRKPNKMRLLTSILSQINGRQPQGSPDAQALINSIKQHLQGKSYLIIVDDLWDTSVWDATRGAFPQDNCYSRIIITTQIEDVALASCEDESGQLFLSNSEGLGNDINQIYSKLPPHLKTCLLYLNMYPEDYVIRKDDLVKQWVAEGFLGVEGSFGTQKYQGNTVDGVPGISIEFQHTVIEKASSTDIESQQQVIRDKEDVAGRYFDELVERKMIQPADINYNGQVLSCTVSHSVQDFITQKSIEENFITAIDYPENNTGNLDKVRRLSLNFRGAKIAQVPSNNLTSCHVRSLMFSGFFKCVPPLMKYWLLRVLILDIWSDQEKEILDLALIGELFQLRYLKIECNITIKLPAMIRRLKYLQTLDVAAQVATFPSDIYCLKHLWHLRLPIPTRHYLSNVHMIYHMTSFLSSSSYDVRELVKLANLHDLHLTFSAVPSSHLVRCIEWLVSYLWNCSQLKSLILDSEVPLNKTVSCSSWSDVFSPPDHLEKLVLSPRIFVMSRLPKLIGRLNKLCTLVIAVRELTIGDVGILQKLASLAALSLHVRSTPEKRIVFTNGFQSLKYFKFTCTALCVEFTRGAMPNVQRLKLSFNANNMQQYRPEDAGIGNLGGLKVISARIGAASPDQASREAVKCRLVEAFMYNHPGRRFLKDDHPQSHCLEENHPQLPIINVQMVDWIIHEETEQSSADVIMRGPDDEYKIEETETMEDINRIADSRIMTWEPFSLVQKPGWLNRRPGNFLKIVRGFTYLIRQHLKQAGFRLTNEVASICQDMERLTATIPDSSPGLSQPQEWVLQVQDLAYDIQDFVHIYNWLRIRSLRHALGHVSNIVQLKESIRTLREWPHGGISSHGAHASGRCSASSGLPSSSSPHAPEDRLIGIEEPMSELLELVLLPGEFEKATEQLRMSSIKGNTVEQLSSSHAERQEGSVSSIEGPIVKELLSSPAEVQKPRRRLRFVEGDVVEEVSLPSPAPTEEQRLRVISIVGYRGIGKTALARAVYDVTNTVLSTSNCSAFDRVAWVVASQCSHAGDLLNNICQQVREQGNDTVTDIYMFKEILRNKRFLVVIDDLQDAGLWCDIQSAFPEAHTGSRVIVTTSIGSVAGACSPDRYIYRMRGLGYSDAEKLFWTRVDSRTDRTPSLEYALEDTLRKSGGLPLALVSVANYLCRKRQNLAPGAPGAFEEMNRVLSQCYNSLPDNGHRTCFLSLTAFPQGHLIKRKKLIRRWIAEGLAVGDGVLGPEQVASNRFDEMINRNLIEPVLTGHNSKVKEFLVLGVIKDFIVNKSVSEELVTLIHNDELLYPNKKVAHPIRRLSVQGGTTHTERVAKRIELDRVRSLTICNTVPFDFKDCWLLRVLDLDACQGVDKMVVHSICKLVFLKYLSLRGSDVYKVSKKIKKLECLETLDIRETRVETLPIEVLMLPRLAHLFGKFELPQQLKDPTTRSKLQGFFSDKSRLQTLSGFIMVENNGFEHIVLDMRLLRKITIWCKHSITSSYQHILTSSIQKRLAGRNALDSVSINFGNKSINFLNNIGAPCALIGSMKLWGRLKSLPSFITSHDTTLSELQLSSTGLTIEALSLLQNLRRLLYLKFIEDGDGFCGDRFVVQSGGFPSLQRLCFEALKLPQICIHEGGMSSLTSLLLICPEFPTYNNTVSQEIYKEGGPKISLKKIDSDKSSEEIEEIEENDSNRRSKEMKRTDLEMSFNEFDLAKKIETNYSDKLETRIVLKKHFKGFEHLQRLNELVLHPSVSHEILDAWKEEARSHVNKPKVIRGSTSMLSLNGDSTRTTKKNAAFRGNTSDNHVVEVPVRLPEEQENEITDDQIQEIKGKNMSMPKSFRLQLHKYILLLASVVAMVTYAAGFSPPGGVWKDTAAGHLAGVPIIRDTHYHRYLVFFYFNATAFAASIVVIILVNIVAYLDAKNEKNRWVAVHRSLKMVMVLDLLSLMGAYAAATYQQDTFATVYSSLLLSFVFIYLVFIYPRSIVLDTQKAVLLKPEERLRKALMVLATFSVSITYTAGLSTPGGIWDTTEAGHHPGDSILKDLHKTRLTVFLGFNTAAFVASLLIIIVLLDTKLRKKNAYGFIVATSVSLVAAYIAGSCRQAGTTFYMVSLVAGVLVYILFLAIIRAITNHGPAESNSGRIGDEANNNQAAPEYRPTEEEKAAYKVPYLVMLLGATLAATITYQAGLHPPGGIWQDNKNGNMAGDPILLTVNARRYKAFFYCNSVAFVASLVAIILLVQKMVVIGHRLLNAVMVLNLLGLAGAYVAGSSWDVSTSIKIMLMVGAILGYPVIHVVLVLITRDKADNTIRKVLLNQVCYIKNKADNIKTDGELMENIRKRLLVFAILLTTMTYKAGLTPPGGFLLQDNQPGHAGDPVLLHSFPGRYKAFIYCNSVSFILSIALIILLINPKVRSSHVLFVYTAAGLLGLMGAYAAGSAVFLKTSIYIFVLSAAVLCFLVIQFMVYRLTGGSTHVMVRTNTTTTQEAAMETNTQDNITTKRMRVHAKRKYLMLLGILVLSATYQAGLEPPGGNWQSTSGDYAAGNPILHDNRRTRYLAFFYSNSTSFMASIVVILLLLVPKKLLFGHHKHTWLRQLLLNTTIVVELLGLLAAYAAGSTSGIKTSLYVIIMFIAVLAYSGFRLVLSRFIMKSQSNNDQVRRVWHV